MASKLKGTMEQLRRILGYGASGKAMPAPAASPLGTDDEAAGTTPTPERIEMAGRAEERIKAVAARSV